MYLLLRGEKVIEEFVEESDATVEKIVMETVHPGLKYRVTTAASRAVEECLALLALGQNEKEAK